MIFSTFSNILTVMTAFFRGDLSKQWQEHIFHVFHGNEADACIIFQLAVPPFARPLWYIHQRRNYTTETTL